MSAQYLIRFDDICPTMNWRVWDRVEAILVDAAVRPLLAVVPDNHDPELRAGPEHANFWGRVRDWQQRGWGMGLHGFQHCYLSASAGILGRNRYSEFAGLPEPVQSRKLERALAVFHREGIEAQAWIAPAHSFDEVTVRLLKRMGVHTISDGYSLFPYACREGMLWIPQQLGRFYPLPCGIWTVCLHINGWTEQHIQRFREDVTTFRQIVSLEEIQRRYQTRSRTLSDQLFFNCFRTIRSLKA